MGALQDGVNWTINTAEKTGEGLSQIFNGLSSTSDFNSTYLPLFTAGLAGIVAIGLISNRHTIFDMGKDLLTHPVKNAIGGVVGAAKIGLGAGLIMFAMGTVAEYAKTGNLFESAQTTMGDFGRIISSTMNLTHTPTHDPALPNPSVDGVPVVRVPSSLSR